MAAWPWPWGRDHAQWAWPAGAIRCRSSCPAIACWPVAAAKAATPAAAGCRPSGNFSPSKASYCFRRQRRQGDAGALGNPMLEWRASMGYGERMRVLITRPEREAAALAQAVGERGHLAVIAPLFQLHFRRPPDDFAAALAASQAVLLTSVNGARALAEATEQRSKPILAVGDTTAATAEGLGFTSVTSASGDSAALAKLVQDRLDPKGGPLIHVSGVDVAGEPAPKDIVRRFALYEAREAGALPDSARAAHQARALDAATFFSPRAARAFVRLVVAAGLGDACRTVTAIAISPAAAEPLEALPFKATIAAARPTRQAVLDEIDRLAEGSVHRAE